MIDNGTTQRTKISFLKRIKIALIDLEDYMLFIPEKVSKAFGFMLIMSLILAMLLTASEVINIIARYGSFGNCLEQTLPDFTYTNNEIKVIDEKEVDSETIILIEDILKSSNLPFKDFSKKDIVDAVNSLPMEAYVIGIVFYAIFNLCDLFMYWLMTALMLVILAYLLLAFSKIKMKFRAAYAISIYASTLSIILTVIYSILNMCFGVYIDIFDYMFIIIAYIYISAVILLIRSELIKQQMELIKIVTVQKEVKKELDEEKEKEREKKRKEKDKEQKEKDKEKSNEDEKKGEIPDEPDGSEI